jgi:hypothetical protein
MSAHSILEGGKNTTGAQINLLDCCIHLKFRKQGSHIQFVQYSSAESLCQLFTFQLKNFNFMGKHLEQLEIQYTKTVHEYLRVRPSRVFRALTQCRIKYLKKP